MHCHAGPPLQMPDPAQLAEYQAKDSDERDADGSRTCPHCRRTASNGIAAWACSRQRLLIAAAFALRSTLACAGHHTNLAESSKAAPRFELGIKDLQSSALPLGHVAGNRRSHQGIVSATTLAHLLISNGHGEDLIATKALEAIHRHSPKLPLAVLPLVGRGDGFSAAVKAGWLERIGPTLRCPAVDSATRACGGAVRSQSRAPLLSWTQWRLVRRQARRARDHGDR